MLAALEDCLFASCCLFQLVICASLDWLAGEVGLDEEQMVVRPRHGSSDTLRVWSSEEEEAASR